MQPQPRPSHGGEGTGSAAGATARGRFQPGQARLDAFQRRADAIAARRRRLLEVAALQDVQEDIGDLGGTVAALWLVPLVEPVAHAENAEHHQGGRQVPEETFVDAVAIGAFDRAVVLTPRPRRALRHGRRQAGLLGKENLQEGQVAGQERYLISHDTPELLVGGQSLADDLGEAGAERFNRALENETQELVLAPNVAIERDLGETRLGRDRVEGGGAVPHLAEAGGRHPEDFTQGRRARRLHTAPPLDSGTLPPYPEGPERASLETIPER